MHEIMREHAFIVCIYCKSIFPQTLVYKFIDDVITIIYNCIRGGTNVTNKRKYPNGQ